MFFYSNLLTALGYSLLSSIWQMALTWSFYYLLSGRNKRFTAAIRHDLILTLCMVNVFWFFYSLVYSFNQPKPSLFPGFINDETIQTWLPFLSAVYLLILFCRTFTSGFQLYRQKKIRFKPIKFIPAHWQEFANRQAGLLGISKRIRLFFSDCVDTAETSGFLKPIILMPVSLTTNLSAIQLEAIIVHELLHIRRNDFLIHLLMTCYRHVFFFNPFAHIFYHTLSHQRELACDDAVVERNISPQIYADALFRLEKHRQIPVVFTVAADGHKPWLLRERIARLLGTPVTTQSRVRVLPYLGVVIALFLSGLSPQTIRKLPSDIFPEKQIVIIPVNLKTRDQSFPITKIHIQLKQKLPASVRKQIMLKQPVAEIQILNSNTEPPLPDIVQYANHREIRNFSNERSTKSIESTTKSIALTPYVPEQSFEFNPEIADNQSDSLIEIQMKEVVAFTLIQKTAIKNQLKSAENKLSGELKNIEKRRKVYQRFNEKDFKQLLNRLQEQIEQKKVEIDRINIQTQSLDEEIIHI